MLCCGKGVRLDRIPVTRQEVLRDAQSVVVQRHVDSLGHHINGVGHVPLLNGFVVGKKVAYKPKCARIRKQYLHLFFSSKPRAKFVGKAVRKKHELGLCKFVVVPHRMVQPVKPVPNRRLSGQPKEDPQKNGLGVEIFCGDACEEGVPFCFGPSVAVNGLRPVVVKLKPSDVERKLFVGGKSAVRA